MDNANDSFKMDNANDSFDILAELDRIEVENEKYLEQKIGEATRAGKEVFDINVLKRYYHPQGLMRSGIGNDISEDMIESYRRQYYLTFPDIMTMKEFISKLDEQDRYFD